MTSKVQTAKVKIGDQFNGWTVIEVGTRRTDNIVCRCKCGITATLYPYNVIRGQSKCCRSCGGQGKNLTHGATAGGSEDRLYSCWKSMKWRCNPKNKTDSSYSAKNITVCEHWKDDFPTFRDWALLNGYDEKLTLDRIDNEKGYSPQNCRWADIFQQARNRSNTGKIEAFGECKSIVEWSEDGRCFVSEKSLAIRLRKGWDREMAITTPPCHRRPHPPVA